MAARPLICWGIFDFSSETAERNSTKLDRKQNLYQVCIFRADRKNKIAALASDWLIHYWPLHWYQRKPKNQDINVLYSTKFVGFFSGSIGKTRRRPGLWLFGWRHFRLLLWNRWTEFNKIWQEARLQCPLPSLCYLGRSEKQDGRPTSDWLNIFDFSTEWNSTNFEMKQDINVIYQVCAFSGRSEKQDDRPCLWLAEKFSTSPLKMLNRYQQDVTGSKILTSSTKFVLFDRKKLDGRPTSDVQRNLTGSKISTSSPHLYFSGRLGKQDCRPCLWLAETFSTSPLKPQNGIQQSLTGSKISKFTTF